MQIIKSDNVYKLSTERWEEYITLMGLFEKQVKNQIKNLEKRLNKNIPLDDNWRLIKVGGELIELAYTGA